MLTEAMIEAGEAALIDGESIDVAAIFTAMIGAVDEEVVARAIAEAVGFPPDDTAVQDAAYAALSAMGGGNG